MTAKGLQISDVVLVVRRWWWQSFLLGSVLAVLAVGAVWMNFKPSYEATAYLEIKMQSPYVAFPASGESQAFRETQLEIMRNPIVLTKVISQAEIAGLAEAREAEFPLEWLKKRLRVGYVGGSELCQITFQSHDSATTALVANSVMDAYLSLHVDKAAEQTEQIVKLLREEKAKRTGELELLKERVRTMTKQGADKDDQAIAQIIRQSPLAGMEQQRATAEVQCALLRGARGK